MPTRMMQGQSAGATELKQRGLGFAFGIGLSVIKKFPRYRYFHFDLHAGSGFNDEAQCLGSPLSFLSAARRVNCTNFFAGFCDHDHEQVKRLLARPELDQRCRVFDGDNAELLRAAPYLIRDLCHEKPELAIGSVLSDPNGADVPLDAIVEFAATCHRIDVLFHWNSTITKRLRYGIKPQQITLNDVIHLVPKKHWLIREPATAHQFTMLIGRNFPTGDWPSMGFYHIDSARGRDVLQRCSLPVWKIKQIDDQRQGALL